MFSESLNTPRGTLTALLDLRGFRIVSRNSYDKAKVSADGHERDAAVGLRKTVSSVGPKRV